MNKCETLWQHIELIDMHYQEFKKEVENASDEQIDGILHSHFCNYAHNICAHFDFLH